MWMVAAAAPVQILVGVAHGLNTQENPGRFQSHPNGAPLVLARDAEQDAATVTAPGYYDRPMAR